MTARRNYGAERSGSSAIGRALLGAAGRRLLSWSIAVTAIVMAALVGATLLAPRLTETLRPSGIQPDGGLAFMQGLSLKAPWPWIVPSHPEDALSSGDVSLTEDGAPVGTLEPSHAEIRRLGGGRFDLWQGSLWFSTRGSDPRDPAHSYSVSVGTRLAPDVVEARFWCAATLLVLIALEALRSAAPALAGGWNRHSGPTRRAGTVVGLTVALAVAWLWGRRWRFHAPFLALTIGTLAVFAAWASFEPAPILFQSDSYEYVKPGLRLADGLSMAGSSIRDLGYPLMIFVAARLGSLTNIVPLQFGVVLLALACLLLVMANGFSAMLRESGFPPGRVPVLLTAALAAVGVLYVALLFSHDEFVINMYSLMAEAPHLLPMGSALLCFVAGWTVTSRRRRLVLLAFAADLAFVSTVVKPSSIVAFFLCAASLAAACILYARNLRSRAVIAILLLSFGFIGSVRQLDAWVTPADDDFGAKVLFCNHLDVVDGHLEPTTPERAKIKASIAHVFSLGPDGWPLQGYNGDQCTFVQAFTDEIKAAAKSEGQTPKDWQMHEFVSSLVAHPLRYARHVGRQMVHFAAFPLDDGDQRPESAMTESTWNLLSSYGAFRNVPRERLTGTVPNWFGDVAPDLVRSLKRLLKLMASSFAVVAVASTLVALRKVVRLRDEERLKTETVLLAVGVFTTALPMTVALSHSFDVGRYSVDILPFTVLWWCLGLVYLLFEALRATAATLRARGRRTAEAG